MGTINTSQDTIVNRRYRSTNNKGGLGVSNYDTLESAFPNSPIYGPTGGAYAVDSALQESDLKEVQSIFLLGQGSASQYGIVADGKVYDFKGGPNESALPLGDGITSDAAAQLADYWGVNGNERYYAKSPDFTASEFKKNNPAVSSDLTGAGTYDVPGAPSSPYTPNTVSPGEVAGQVNLVPPTANAGSFKASSSTTEGVEPISTQFGTAITKAGEAIINPSTTADRIGQYLQNGSGNNLTLNGPSTSWSTT